MQKFCFRLSYFVLFILSLCIYTTGNPVSSPEINSHSVQNNNNQINTNNFPQNAQDALINTLNSYVSSYNTVSSTADGNKAPFKPSYKLPPMENNFVPLQSGANNNNNNNNQPPSAVALTTDVNTASATSINSGTPLLMQYMPQMMREGGIQYLQLIPTHPLIVPISPYLSAGANPTAAAYPTPELQASNSLAEYAGQSAAIYTTNSQPPASTKLVDLQSNIPPGMQLYANNLHHYRNAFRINREIKDTQLPIGMSLNINEYIPVNPEALNGLYIRGRP